MSEITVMNDIADAIINNTPSKESKGTEPKIVVGLAGLAGAGKDTFAALLGEGYEHLSFAAPIKRMLRVGFGLTDKDPSAEERFGVTYRHFAQTLGTQWGRNCISKDIWTKLMAYRISLTEGDVIITDVRFEDEAEFVRKRGLLIHIFRNDHELIKESEHESEAGIIVRSRDIVVCNNSDLAALSLKAALVNVYLQLRARSNLEALYRVGEILPVVLKSDLVRQ